MSEKDFFFFPIKTEKKVCDKKDRTETKIFYLTTQFLMNGIRKILKYFIKEKKKDVKLAFNYDLYFHYFHYQ